MGTRKARDKFPLWLHPGGQWCKKIHGKHRYFGTDRDKALKEYVRTREDLEAGRKPRPKPEDFCTVAELVNSFLDEKKARVDAGDLSARTWADYYHTCDRVVDHLGKTRAVSDLRPDDFAKLRATVAGKLGPVSVLNFVTRVRVLFKFAYDFGLIDYPVKYGSGFDRPAKKTLRVERARKGMKLIPAGDLWKLIQAADVQLRAMILLALNGAMGSSDCAQLPRTALEFRPGWLDFARVKTGTPRRFPLWPETAEALDAVHPKRPKPKGSPGVEYTRLDALVFLTRLGQPWTRFNGAKMSDEEAKATGRVYRRSVIDSVAQQFAKLGKKADVKLPGGFYTLRHIHRTVSDEARDRPAADLIMGHADPSVTNYYREHISDERLKAVTDHVREWLLKGKPKK
jgi:integrase